MAPQPSILVVGEALVDVVVPPEGPAVKRPGGSPANVAVALGRLGVPVTLLTALGADEHGDLLRRHLSASGVTLAASPTPRTSIARARLDRDGRAAYEFDVIWDLEVPDALPSVGWLHVGSIAVTQGPGADAVRALVQRCARRGTVVSYDVNCRPALMGTPSAVHARIDAQVRSSTVVKLSDEDAAWLFPGESAAAVAGRWLRQGPELVVMTLGPHGARVWTRDGEQHVPAPPTAAVADTVGAGDAFMAGLLWQLSSRPGTSLSDPAVLREALRVANDIARRTCERHGADPPWRDELG